MLEEDLLWLLNWFDSHCCDRWESLFGIKIHTIDNPGWAITISIQETELENKPLEDIFVDRTDTDWYVSRIENKSFKGYCGVFNLKNVIHYFRNFVEDGKSVGHNLENNDLFSTIERKNNKLNNYWLWVINWYESQCNGDWEHCYGIGIDSLSNPGWSVSIDVSDTDLEDKIFEKVCIERSEKNWLLCKVENGSFQAHCGTFNLMDVFETFKNWAES